VLNTDCESACFFCITIFITCAGKDWAGRLFIRERGLLVSPSHTMNVASCESCRVAEVSN